MRTLVIIAVWSALGIFVIYWSLHGVWRLRSAYRRARAEPRGAKTSRALLWRDPGRIEQLDLAAGPGGHGGAPTPPFRFVEEHTAGSSPCLSVVDSRDRTWRVKWGDEVRAESFAVRFCWAVGYFAEATYFVPEGRIDGADGLQRARGVVGEDGTFHDARFELDERGVTKLFDEHGWSWNDNPFVGTHELNGLKILMMLLSNWDNKDVRDVARGSNTAIFQHRGAKGVVESRYLIIDWGGSMGRWGTLVLTRGKWDCAGYEAQTPDFVTGVTAGVVSWGYSGQRTADAAEGIIVGDVRWIWSYLKRLTDRQIQDALRASGASEDEVIRFGAALRARLRQLEAVTVEGDAFRRS